MVLAEALWAEKLAIPAVYTNLPVDVQGALDELQPLLPPDVPAEGVAMAIIIWSAWHGLVWGEITGHLPPGLGDSGELFMMEVGAMIKRMRIEN